MSWDEFQRLPRPLGWKVEYWDGHARLTPRLQSVITSVDVRPRPVPALVRLRPVTPEDEVRLVPVYTAAFLDSMEYCDCEPAEVDAAARQNLANYFGAGRGRPHPASRVALDVDQAVAGAALLVELADGLPLLDMLFVLPSRQRQGLATALVSAAVNELCRDGSPRLRSSYMLGNEPSRAWHQRFGFVEEPDLLLARQLRAHAWHRLHLREQAGDLTGAERVGLEAECARCDAWAAELEARAARDGIDALLPLLPRHATDPAAGRERGSGGRTSTLQAWTCSHCARTGMPSSSS
jgi:RimJ/RimL family protein N-acetyltransferase